MKRYIVEPMDPRVEVAGGVDTCIRGIIRHAPRDLTIGIIGADLIGDLALGEWHDVSVASQTVQFMPLSRGPADGTRPRTPHVLQLAMNTLRYRPNLADGVVQAHRPLSGFIYRLAYPRNTHVQFIHNDGVENLRRGGESYFSRAKPIYRALERSAVRSAAATVVFSRSGAERLNQYGGSVRFSPTWFDDAMIADFELHSARADPDQLLWVGRVDNSKDPVLAIETLRRLPETYRLSMVGDGPLLSEVADLVRRHNLQERVELLGRRPKIDIPALMSAAGVLLMTSRYEGYPRVVVEALSVGLPVATTLQGEPNSLVREGINGARSDASRSPEDLAAAVERARSVSRLSAQDSVKALKASVLVPEVLRVPGSDTGGGTSER